ncbi:MAG: hypothetical protein PVSMB7_28670 [Chloroflexota bacterium]
MAEDVYTFKVFRGDAGGGVDQEFKVPGVEGMVVLDAMLYIQAHMAQDLAVRWNCKAAHCGSCSAEVNGFPKLMCKTRLDLYRGQDIYVHPMRTFPVIKDLVTDVSWNYHVNQQIAPLTPDPADKSPWIMHQQDVDRLYEPRKCIECFLCQDVCHVLRNHSEMNQYYGPRYMLRYQYVSMHPKDTLDRRGAIKNKGGIGMCNITKCCQEVCPEHIKITDNAIIPLKERVADEYFDPVRWVGRKVFGKTRTKRTRESETGPEAARVPVGTPLRPNFAHHPGATGQTGDVPFAQELRSLLKDKEVRTADRANIQTLLDSVNEGRGLTNQERQTLWSYLDRYGRLEGKKTASRTSTGE